MASYDSADLLARLIFQLRRPAVDESLSTVQAYQLLTDGQQALYEDVVTRAPFALIGPTTAMTTADGGATWQFGTNSNGDLIVPMGKVGIYPTLNSVPDYPWTLDIDYLDEGSQIRLPNNRTWPTTLYWRGVLPPNPISATSAPSFVPAADRVLIVYWAAAEYATLGNLRPDDHDTYRAKYTEGLGRSLLRMKTQFKAGAGAYGAVTGQKLAMIDGY